MPQLGSVPSKQVQLKHITNRAYGTKLLLLGKFGDISEKKIAVLNAIQIKIRIFLEPFKN